jgi:hypothetical protein
MGRGHKPTLPLPHLLFLTWLFMGGGMMTGLAPALAIPVGVLLTVLLLHFAHRQERKPGSRTRGFARAAADDRGALGPLAPGEDEWAWSLGSLSKLGALRRRERARAGARPARRLRADGLAGHAIDLTSLLEEEARGREGPIPAAIPEKAARERKPHPALDPRPGVLLALALLASSLTVSALISETSRLVQFDGRLDVARLIVLCGVVVLPVVIGIASRCDLHSVLTMVGLSAAVQTFLLQASPSVPDGLFLGLAAPTLLGIPPLLAWLFRRVDRRSGGESIETTTGRLLESKQARMSRRANSRLQPGRNP